MGFCSGVTCGGGGEVFGGAFRVNKSREHVFFLEVLRCWTRMAFFFFFLGKGG